MPASVPEIELGQLPQVVADARVDRIVSRISQQRVALLAAGDQIVLGASINVVLVREAGCPDAGFQRKH